MARTTDVMSLSGMDSFQRALKEAPAAAIEGAKQAIASSTFAVTSRAIAGAPSATGRLKGSISAKVSGLTGRVIVSGDAYYWRFVEFGTIHMVARPFVRTAVEAETVDFERRLQGIAKHLERDFTGSRFG